MLLNTDSTVALIILFSSVVGKNSFMIREQLEKIVGEELRIPAIKTRARLCFTQKEMEEPTDSLSRIEAKIKAWYSGGLAV